MEALFVSQGALEKEKQSARGTMGRKREKRGSRLYPLPIVLLALSIFRLLLFSLGYLAGASAEERELSLVIYCFNVTPNAHISLFNVKVILTLCEKQLFTKLLELLRLLLNLYLSLKKETQNIINGARKPKRTLGSWKTLQRN